MSPRPDEIELSTSLPALSRTSSAVSTVSKFPPSPPDLPIALPHLTTVRTQTRTESQERSLCRYTGGQADEADGVDAEGLPPVDRGIQAYIFVVAGFVLETFVWGFSYSFPSILVHLQQHSPWRHSSLATLSSIGSILLALQFFLPIFVMAFFRRYPEWRIVVLSTSVVVNCGAMLVASWATETWHLIILQGVLGGITGAILYSPVLIYLNEWFVQKKGFASGIVFSGSSIGGTAFPFAINHILENYGFAVFCRVWAAVTFVTYSYTVYGVRPRLPSGRPKRGERVPWMAVRMGALLNPVVLVMCGITLISSLPYYQVAFYLPTYTLSLSSNSASTATLVVSLVNGAASIGSIAIGWASDKNLPWTIATLGLASGVTALLAWGFASTLMAVFVFAIVYAPFTAVFSIWGAGARDVAGGNSHFSTMILGTFSVARGIASIIGPSLGTALYSPKEAEERPVYGRFGFSRVIICVGLLSLLSTLGGPALVWARKVNARREEEEEWRGARRGRRGSAAGSVTGAAVREEEEEGGHGHEL